MTTVLSDSLRGFTAKVDQEGSLQARVAGTVATTRAAVTLDTDHRGADVSTTSSELVGATTGRQALYISNNGAAAVYLRFGTGAASANDFLLPAGERVTFHPVGDDSLKAISAAGTCRVAVIEWKV